MRGRTESIAEFMNTFHSCKFGVLRTELQIPGFLEFAYFEHSPCGTLYMYIATGGPILSNLEAYAVVAYRRRFSFDLQKLYLGLFGNFIMWAPGFTRFRRLAGN